MLQRSLITAVLMTVTSMSSADTIHVPGDHATIQAALDAADFFGDTVQIAAGTYFEHELDANGKSVQVIGDTNTDGSPAVKIDAQQQGIVVQCVSNEQFTTGFKNLIFTGGDSFGGGAYLFEASPTFTNCRFLENSSTHDGGGVYITGGQPRFVQCVIDGNECLDNGGGVYADSSAVPEFINCTITGNSVTNYGGGVYASDDSILNFSNCTISGNTSSYMGGGLALVEADLTMEQCEIADNSTYSRGGGLYIDESPTTMTSCTISGNTGANYGGGIYIDYETLSLTDCTITTNTASEQGGGIMSWDTEVQLDTSTVCDNSPDQLVMELLTVVSCAATSTTCEGDVNADGVVDVTDLLLVIGNWSNCP